MSLNNKLNARGNLIQGIVVYQFRRVNVLPDPVLHFIYRDLVDRPDADDRSHKPGQKSGNHKSGNKTIL
jgi:hypothetical protein